MKWSLIVCINLLLPAISIYRNHDIFFDDYTPRWLKTFFLMIFIIGFISTTVFLTEFMQLIIKVLQHSLE
jgi:hypothetical protein